MSEAVEKKLAEYAGENPGVIGNLRRMLEHGTLAGTGKMVILPVDQGFEHGPGRSFGPNPAGYDPMLPPAARHRVRLQRVRGAARLHRGRGAEVRGQAAADPQGEQQRSARPTSAGYQSALTSQVHDAVRLGCSAIGFTIYPGSSFRNEMYEQIRDMIAEARDVGPADRDVGVPARQRAEEGRRDRGRRDRVRRAHRLSARRAHREGEAADRAHRARRRREVLRARSRPRRSPTASAT